jgi:hypothetical protein
VERIKECQKKKKKKKKEKRKRLQRGRVAELG